MKTTDTSPFHRIPILDVAKQLGIEVRGKQAMCFGGHDSKTASLAFQPEKNLWRCFGACGRSGDTISLVMEKIGVDFMSALDWLAQRYNTGNEWRNSTFRPKKVSRVRRSSMAQARATVPVAQSPPDHELFSWFMSECRPVTHAIGRAYLNSHGISTDLASQIGIRELNDPARVFQLLVSCWGLERASRSGIITRSAHGAARLVWASFAIVFPFHEDGKVIYLQGRLFSGRAKYLGLVGVVKPLFNAEILRALPLGSRVHLCEGVPDAVALTGQGLKAVAVLGATSFRREWIESMLKFDIVLLPDGDIAGEKFSVSVTKLFAERGKSVQVVRAPAGKDVADVIATFGKQK